MSFLMYMKNLFKNILENDVVDAGLTEKCAMLCFRFFHLMRNGKFSFFRNNCNKIAWLIVFMYEG